RLLEKVNRWIPSISFEKADLTDSFVGFRAYTPDKLPLIGPAGDTAPNLFLFTGFGSRGFVTAPFAADILASELCGDIVPLEKDIRAALLPARYFKGLEEDGQANYGTIG